MITRTLATRCISGIVTLTVAAAVAACGTSTDTTGGGNPAGAGPAPTDRTHNQADVTFLQGMIPHHEQAVAMSRMAAAQAQSTQVKDLAGRIQAAQQPEIDQMNGLLRNWSASMSASSEPPMSGMNGGDMGGMDHSAMPGMMTSTQMQQLGQVRGTSFDAMFLRMMIGHHQGAITMSNDELRSGQNPDAKALAHRIITAQQGEITQMQGMDGK